MTGQSTYPPLGTLSTPCEVFTEVSGAVRKWIEQQPAVKEESLTDWLLYSISQKLPNVRYRAFTRHQEAKETGADWEWWILMKNGCYQFRVQAKKVYDSRDNYADLARTNRYGLQIEKLIDDSLRANAIPIYALFYAGSEISACARGVGTDGVFLADAAGLFAGFVSAARTDAPAVELIAASVPLSCLVCCSLVTNSLDRFIIHYFRGFRNLPTKDDGLLGRFESPPHHILSLLEYETVSDAWDSDYSRRFQDVNAVVVCDFRSLASDGESR